MDFKELLANSYQGRFVVEPNELTEIHVDYGMMQIIVLTFGTKNQFTPKTKTVYHGLHGMFGKPSVEDKFNEIMKNFNR
jgi:hypothetical protein